MLTYAKKIVLAYSVGLDTSVILKWLQLTYNCPVVTFTANLGQGDELDSIKDKAASDIEGFIKMNTLRLKKRKN